MIGDLCPLRRIAAGVWFTDDDVQSSYGTDEIIYCGYPDGSGFRGLDDASPLRRRSAAPLNQHDPETELYYVRNRTYSPILGRWLQRDPIGYAGGVNLYGYVGGRAVVEVDPAGLQPQNICHAACRTVWLYCTVFGGEVEPWVCAGIFFACILACDVPPPPPNPGPQSCPYPPPT